MKLPKPFSKRGFTLIELLVVITIIIILAAVVMIAINPAEMARRGRDATRLSDLENVRKAIDLGVAEGLIGTIPGTPALPVTGDSQANARTCSDANWVGAMNVCAYLSTLPVDPRHADGAPWQYEFAADGTGYELRVQLESPSNDTKEANDGGDDPTWYEVGTDQGLNLL